MSDLDAARAAAAQGRHDEARRILAALGPRAADDPAALQLWALTFPTEQSAVALALLERAVNVAPNSADAHFNLAVCLQARGLEDRALIHYRQALLFDAGHVGGLNNLSELMRRGGRSEEGWSLIARYLQAGGVAAGQELRIAKLALDTGRFNDARIWFDAARRRTPDDALAELEQALFHLSMGEWAAGWKGYDARFRVHAPAALGLTLHPDPPWEGQLLRDRALLLHREQAPAEVLMFAAAAPALLEDGVKLHLAIHPALVRLLSTSLPGAGVWSAMNGADWPQPWRGAVGPIDFQAPIGALGRLRMPAGPPSPGVWLRPAAAIQEQWRQRFDALSPPRREEPRIGLAPWPLFGSAATATPPPAQAMDRLMGAWRARWHLLRDFRSDALAAAMRAEFVDLAPWISDAADLAGALASLDAVVTCDPLVALVGVGLGKPVFVLTSTPTDWRWGHADTSPFARGARLYRQDRSGTWDAAIDRLTTDVA